MEWYILFLLVTGHFPLTQPACTLPVKFYVDCGQTRTASAANLFCLSHQMTLLNLTNGTVSLASDIALLNTTFQAMNCNGNFWFSSGSQTGLAGSVNDLGNLLGNLLGGVLNLLLCLLPLGLCPATTTPAPITNAFTVCTRPVQQHVIQKCVTQTQRVDMQQFRFNDQSMQAGILDTFPARSLMACSGTCSSNDECVATSYKNGICTLYM
jgi:hypothetical protein